MVKDQSEIAKNLYESNLYFDDGMKWYRDLYLSSKINRNIYLLISIILILGIIVLGLLIHNIIPRHTKSHLVISQRSTDEDKITISKINKYSHPTLAIAEIMINNYVKLREEYVYPGIYGIQYVQDKIKRIQLLSTRDVFVNFEKTITQEGGFIYNFQHKTSYNVDIESVAFDGGKSFADTMMYMLYPGKIPKSARAIINQETNGVTKKHLIDLEFEISIPPIGSEPDIEFIPKNAQEKTPSNDTISKMKHYIAGTKQAFDPKITFIITKYQKRTIG